MRNKRLDLLQGTLEHLVLQTLKQGEMMHGFEVLECALQKPQRTLQRSVGAPPRHADVKRGSRSRAGQSAAKP